MGDARDWGLGVGLKQGMLGKTSRLEVHHIFPKSLLRDLGHRKPLVNALANFCLQTQDTNLKISNRRPEDYFPEIEAAHPGALESQWIPMDERLWKLENYEEFLLARQELLAAAANEILEELWHGPLPGEVEGELESIPVPGGIADDEEEAALQSLNDWAQENGLASGTFNYELYAETDQPPICRIDLAWPDGLQTGMGNPVALMLGEDEHTAALASQQNYQVFEDCDALKNWITRNMLEEPSPAVGA
jgi:hypothetical protein